MSLRHSRTLACLVALVAATGCPTPTLKLPHAPRITNFSADQMEGDSGQLVTFTWQVEDADGDPVIAVLSVDADGRADYSIADALASTSQQHAYRNAGSFAAQLRVSDGTLESSATTSVIVRGPIAINTENPAAGQEVGWNMDVVGTFQSVHDPVSVEAQVEDRVAALSMTFDEPGGVFRFTGKLNVAGLPFGTRTLTVRIRDEAGNLAEQPRSFWYHGDPPSLEVFEPLTGDVATPLIHVRGRCTTTNPAGCTVTLPDDRVLTGVNGDFDEEFDLSAQNGEKVQLMMRATDSVGQTAKIDRDVWVESSAALVPVFRLDADVISDVSAAAAVGARKHGVWWDTLAYQDRTSGELIEHVMASRDVGRAMLTPTGCVADITYHCAIDTSCHSLYELRGQTFSLLIGGQFTWSSALLGRGGDFVLWSQRATLSLYNTRDQSMVTITPPEQTDQGVVDGVVASDGTVVYATRDKVFQYKDGVSREIYAATQYYQEFRPTTDGSLILYSRLNGDRTESVLVSDAGETVFDGAAPHRISNGWISFARTSAFGVQEAWLRDAAGAVRELAPDVRADKTIDLLMPDGRVTFRTQEKHYLALPDGTATEIGTNLGNPFLIDGTLHMAIGRVLFRVEP